jgi:hypothetical protein
MTETDELRAAFCTTCEIIQELACKVGVVESWQDVLSEMASHAREKALFIAIQHGQIVGKLLQDKRNLLAEVERLKKTIAASSAPEPDLSSPWELLPALPPPPPVR